MRGEKRGNGMRGRDKREVDKRRVSREFDKIGCQACQNKIHEKMWA